MSLQRQQIKEQLGTLEEQLELLGPLARAETIETFRNLAELVHSDSLRKSLPADEFLSRVVTVLVQEASKLDYKLAVSHHGEGRISAEMVEVSMGAILACLKASLRSYKGMGPAIRMQHGLFRTFSLYIDLRATTDGLHFRLFDDGKGYGTGFISELDQDVEFKKLRAQVATRGGWFTRQSFPGYGGMIEFQMPLPRARFECLVLQQGEFELLVPRSYCAKVIDMTGAEAPFEENDLVGLLSPEQGLRPIGEEEKVTARYAVLICVADFRFWILCGQAELHVKARSYPCADFLEHDAWFKKLGLYPQQGILKTLPLLDGEDLMHFHGRWEDPHARF